MVFAPCARQKFARFPHWWRSMCTTNVREIPTVVAATGQRRHTTQMFIPHVSAPRKFQDTRWINKKRWQLFLLCCDHGSQPETRTHTHLVTHPHQPQFEVGRERAPIKMTTILRATWSLWVKIASTRRRHGVFFVLKRTAGESRVPERPCGFPRETGRVCFPEKKLCSCSAVVKLHVRIFFRGTEVKTVASSW